MRKLSLVMRSAPTGSGEASPLQPRRRVAAAGYLQDTFNHNHQLINTNTLLTETAQGTISVGSKLCCQYNSIEHSGRFTTTPTEANTETIPGPYRLPSGASLIIPAASLRSTSSQSSYLHCPYTSLVNSPMIVVMCLSNAALGSPLVKMSAGWYSPAILYTSSSGASPEESSRTR